MQTVKIESVGLEIKLTTTALRATADKFNKTITEVPNEIATNNIEVIIDLFVNSVKAAGGKLGSAKAKSLLDDPAVFIEVWQKLVKGLEPMAVMLLALTEKKQ